MDGSLEEPLRIAIYRAVGRAHGDATLSEVRITREGRYVGADKNPTPCIVAVWYTAGVYADVGVPETYADKVLANEGVAKLAAFMAGKILVKYGEKTRDKFVATMLACAKG